MALKKYVIKSKFKSVYYFLKNQNFSENYISNLRKKMGYIKVNGEITNMRHPLNYNDILEIEDSPNNKSTIMHCILPLNIVYEDRDYLLVYKESGIPCMPTKTHYNYNLAGAICYYMKDKSPNFVLRIINRLDKDTAGIIIVAKNSIAQKDIKNINKTYAAVCKGIIDKPIIIDKKIETISNNGINQIKRIISNIGKDAKTFVKPICSNKNINMSLIELELEHGRTHQIRIHLSSINHPLIGDEIYGEKSNYINHTALVCNKLTFFHPYKNKIIKIDIPYPNDFSNLINIIKN